MAYAPSNPPDTGNRNLERYLAEEFQQVSNEIALIGEAAVRLLVAIGYGGISRSIPVAAADLGAAFTTIAGWDTGQVSDPVDVQQNFLLDNLVIERAGVWLFNIHVTFGHDSLNAGRTTSLRVWNATQGTALETITVGTGRNAEYTTFSISFLSSVDVGVGDLIQLQMGGGDVYSAVVYETLSFSVNHVSELQSL